MLLKPPLLSLGLISATALAYEILLMRLFSIIQWHHFAYMIISLALLGYGISGTLVSLLQEFLKRKFHIAYPLFLFFFSVSSVACFLLAQIIPFNPEAIIWDSKQFWHLLSLFLLFSIPFLLVASAICLVFLSYPGQIGKIYAVDLLGAGIGSISIIILLYYLFPISALMIISLIGLVATLIALHETQIKHKEKTVSFFIILTGALVFLILQNQILNISPYKDEAKILNISGTKIIEQQSSPLGLLSIIESKKIPFRHAPGLSLYNTKEPPEQLGLFTDASNMTAITRFPDNLEQLSYLDQLTSALPYHLKEINTLLIVGAGGGSDILQAMFHNTSHIDTVELNPQIIEILSGPFADYSGNIFLQDNVHVYSGDIREFLSRTPHNEKEQYDLIQISLMDSFNASASGLYALNESYLYTVEALQLYLEHLNQDGYLAISRWVKTPPRDTIKMFATAVSALSNTLITEPAKHLMLIRGWQTSTILVKKSPFNSSEVHQLKQFCQTRGFDVAWYPGIKSDEANQLNRFREAYFYQAASALLNQSKKQTPYQFINNYKYYISPASDDKPFFHHFFKWSVLSELISLHKQGGLALVEMGHIVLLATLILAVISSIILILLPLLIFHLRSKSNTRFSLSTIGHLKLFSYFFSIGLAFLFIEIAMMQKFILFLHHPIYAIPVVLSAFMIFAGLGSALTSHILSQWSRRQLLISRT
ncbi:MAG: SAM-dependent methyltransferase [Gammaproteobacteria bacterium]|nr:SAM-dependent methyltransferase [Gammaproteobacteria bacterium]